MGEFSALLFASIDDGKTYTEVTDVDVCHSCHARSIVCQHNISTQEVEVKLPENCTHIKLRRGKSNERYTLCGPRNARLNKITDDLKFSVLESMTKLEDIWQEIGIKEEQKEERNQSVQQYIQEMLSDMIIEEEALKSKMMQSTEECKKELAILYQDLNVTPKAIPDTLSLLELEKSLRMDVDTLNKEKHDRLKTLKRLRGDELLLCDRLVMPQHEITFVGCPTLDQLRELEQNVKFLKSEKMKRFELFKKLQASILQLWKELDVDPFTDIEKSLCVCDADETFVLSSSHLDQLGELQKKMELEHNELLQQISGLREEVKSLWTRLEISKDEQDTFNASVSENTPKTAKMLKAELDRLKEMKRLHMQTFIESVRKEITALWKKCCFGEDQKQLFRPFYTDDFTEASLTEHEHQVVSLKNYYEENKEIFKLTEKREALWAKKIDFENQPADLNNRGGRLLKMEKMRKAIEKDLPKIEIDIQKKLKDWEKENEGYFMYNGMRYIDYLQDQKDAYEIEKEEKKQIKLKAKKEELKEELAFGSKAAKRKLNVTRTPQKVGKMSRMDMTTTPTSLRLVHSSIFASPKRTPATNKENRPPIRKPQSAVKSKIKKPLKPASEMRRQSAKRRSIRVLNNKRALLEKNQINIPPPNPLNESKVVTGSMLAPPNPNASLVSYNEFADAVGEKSFSRSSFAVPAELTTSERGPQMF